MTLSELKKETPEENPIKEFARDQILEKLIDKYNIQEIIFEYPRLADFLNELFKELW